MRRSEDDRVIQEMLAPDVEQAVEALGYWLRRRRGLPVYRRAARREADRMIAFWQSRALSDLPRSPLTALACGHSVLRVSGLAVSYHARRAVVRGAWIAGAVLVGWSALVALALR